MTDLAVLGLRVESHEVAQAEDRLDDLTRSAAQAEKGLDRLGNTARHAGHGVNAIVKQQATIRSQYGMTGRSGAELARTITDVGITAASGMNPLIAVLSALPLLIERAVTTAMRSATGLKGVLLSLGLAFGAALLPFLPLLLAIGAAVGTVAATVGLATRSMNKEFGDLTVGMGLTEKQLEKVQNKGVTSMDVLRGTIKTVGDVIWDYIGPTVTKIGDWFNDAMDKATRFVVNGLRHIAGSFGGTFAGIKAIWSDLPAMIGDAAVSAANAAVTAIEEMLNKAIRAYNRFLPQIKLLLIASGPSGILTASRMGTINEASLGRVANPWSGAAARGGQAFLTAGAEGYARSVAGFDALGERWRNNVRGETEARIRREAGEADDPATRRARQAREPKEKPEVIRLTKFEKPDIEPLRNLKLPELVDPLKLIADELRLIDGLARDMAQGLQSAFGESGRALGDLLTTMSGYQSRIAEINLAESERQLTAAQAARERAQAEIQSYGDMAAAARGFFQEGSDGYRILLAIEQVYRAQQLLGMMQAIIWGRKETAEQVAQDATKAKSGAIVAYVNAIKGLDFPWNIAAGAATIAALAAVGVSLSRGGGGGGKAQQAQEAYDTSQHRAAEGHYAIGYAAGRTIDVRVTADRDGLNAYVENTAERVAAPLAAQAGMAAVSYNRAEQQQAQRRQRQRFA